MGLAQRSLCSRWLPVGIRRRELRCPLQEARQPRRPADGSTEASRCAQPTHSSSFAYRRARRCDRRERGRGPGPWRARALTARPSSLTRSFPASEHSMAVKVTPTLCCCFYCIRDVPRAPECSPPPLSVAFFAWFLTSASRGCRLRVESCARLGPERRGCPAGGGEGGGIVSWRGS